MRIRRALTCFALAAALLSASNSFADEAEEAGKWMKFLQGAWAFVNVENDASGEFVVRKSALDNVLLVRATNKDGKVFVVGVYVWAQDAKTLKLLGGYKTENGEGAVSLTFDKFAEDKASGKNDDDDAVGYTKVDENTLHVTDGGDKVTIKLKRKKRKAE